MVLADQKVGTVGDVVADEGTLSVHDRRIQDRQIGTDWDIGVDLDCLDRILYLGRDSRTQSVARWC